MCVFMCVSRKIDYGSRKNEHISESLQRLIMERGNACADIYGGT